MSRNLDLLVANRNPMVYCMPIRNHYIDVAAIPTVSAKGLAARGHARLAARAGGRPTPSPAPRCCHRMLATLPPPADEGRLRARRGFHELSARLSCCAVKSSHRCRADATAVAVEVMALSLRRGTLIGSAPSDLKSSLWKSGTRYDRRRPLVHHDHVV